MVALAKAGDYESIESQPITLGAGMRVTNLVIECTNTVGQAVNYAADQKTAASSVFTLADVDPNKAQLPRFGRKVLMERPVSDWIIRTNVISAETEIHQIGVCTLEGPESSRARGIFIRFKNPRGSNSVIRSELKDEHGCRFDSASQVVSAIYEIAFSQVPFGAKEFHLRIWRETHFDSNGQSFTNGPLRADLISVVLTNLCGIEPENRSAEALPANRKIGDLAVELTEFDPSTVEDDHYLLNAFGEEATKYPTFPRSRGVKNSIFRFNDSDTPQGWVKVRGRFVDRWGTEATSIGAFCKQEEVFKYQVMFARDPDKGQFADSERLELPLKAVPGPGETQEQDTVYMVNGVPIRVHAISGTGEFAYKDGEFVMGSKEIRTNAFSRGRYFDRSSQSPEKFHVVPVKTVSSNAVPVGSIVFAARVPHISARIPELRTGVIVSLIEHDRSISNNLRRGGLMNFEKYEQVYVPLTLRSDEKNPKLTFVVQEARAVDFFVRVPKRP